MTQTTINLSPETIYELNRQLSFFGLNPLDWQITQRADCSRKFALINNQDEDFRLAGQADTRNPRQPRWTQLTLESI